MLRYKPTKSVIARKRERLLRNVFCPTGKGGGVDPSCSSKMSKIKYDISKDHSDLITKHFGYTQQDIAGLVGAQPGATVKVQGVYIATSEYGTTYISVAVDHPDYEARRTIEKDKIINDSIEIKKTGQGLGTKIFSEQVEYAKSAGFKLIETSATRGYEVNGYYTWARLGYDAKLPMMYGGKPIKSAAQQIVPGAERVSDLMKSPAGRSWWKEHGVSFEGEFDLSDNSLGLKVLREYKANKSQVSNESAPNIEGDERLLDRIWDTIDLVGNAKKATNKKIINPLKTDPTRSATLRRIFLADLTRRFKALDREIQELVVTQDEFGLKAEELANPWVTNVFCPTGKGGGVDPSCPSTVYHGTSLSNLKQIIKSGILPNGSTYKAIDPRIQSVYVATTEKMARRYATRSAIKESSTECVILKIEIPKAKLGEFVIDEKEDDSYRRVGKISPKWIKEAYSFKVGSQETETKKLILNTESKFLFLVLRLEKEATANAAGWRWEPNDKKIELFRQWLASKLKKIIYDEGSSEVTGDAWWDAYIQSAYQKGLGRAWDQIKKSIKGATEKLDFFAGTREQFLQSAFNRPVHRDKVKLMAGRTFNDLKGVTDAMSTKITRTLVDGLIQGQGPMEIARNMSKDVSTIGLDRAKTIARTEITRVHAEGQLDAMERLGVKEVGVSVEWNTAEDEAVCPLCQPMEGVVLSIEESRGLLPRHPNCRCAFVPANIGEDTEGQKRSQSSISKAIEASLKAEMPKKTKKSMAEQKASSKWGGAKAKISKNRPKSILDGPIGNVFCPTGPGGGVDPSCSPQNQTTVVDLEAIDNRINKGVERYKFPTKMYHITSKENIKDIKKNGLQIKTKQTENGEQRGVYLSDDPDGVFGAGDFSSKDPYVVEIDTTGVSLRFDQEFYEAYDSLKDIQADIKGGEQSHFVYSKSTIPTTAIKSIRPYKEGSYSKKESKASFDKYTREKVASLDATYGKGGWEHIYGGLAKQVGRKPTANVFCPTGKGGGIDPTCSPPSSGRKSIGNFAHPDELVFHSTLGGSTGAKLMTDMDGNKFVVKKGTSPGHIRAEYAAERAYEAAGLNVPTSVLYETDDGPVKVSKFIEGKTFDQLSPEQQKELIPEIQKGFAVDALLANWDVVGMSKDNIMLGNDGKVYRIDTGGSLDYRAKGGLKGGLWNDAADEFESMRIGLKNPQAKEIFGSMSSEQLKAGVDQLVADKEDILKALPEKYHERIENRIDSLQMKAMGLGKPSPTQVTPKPKDIVPTNTHTHLHSGGGLHAHLTKNNGDIGLTKVQIEKIKLANPDGLATGKLTIPLKLKGTPELEQLKKYLPEGTVLTHEAMTIPKLKGTSPTATPIAKSAIKKAQSQDLSSTLTGTITTAQVADYHPSIQHWANNLTTAEKGAISTWKGSAADIRHAFASDPPPPPSDPKAKHFWDAISKAPPVEGVGYRGLRDKSYITRGEGYATQQINLIKAAGVGGTWTDISPHGMSRGIKTAKGFASGQLMLKIKAKTARSIEHIGGYKDEKEFIGMPGTKYKITAIHEDKGFKAYVELEEI